jgi:3-oxoacyl-[acyl-carrier protein] reductase
MQLKGRTALVTGASRGIGRAIALSLAQEGADVAVNYVSSEGAAKEVVERILAMGRKAMLAQADVADYPDTYRMAQEVLKQFGHLDILINNAGINSDKTFVKMDHASWRKVLAINLDGVFNCTKVFIDQMLQRGWGRVVNITSVIGQIGNFGQANYAASKAGVAAMTKSLAKELAAKGITINAVAPGFIETAMTARMPLFLREAGRRMNSMAQGGLPVDVAETVAYFAGPGSAGVTGNVLRVCGQSLIGA